MGNQNEEPSLSNSAGKVQTGGVGAEMGILQLLCSSFSCLTRKDYG